MPKWIAIAIYRCEIDGVPVGSLDTRVLGFDLESMEQVRDAIINEPLNSYSNDSGETVSWPLVKIPDILEFQHLWDGSELIGFIADVPEFQEWASPR
jgi:hypothetical protein